MANKQARDARDAGIATAVEHASAVMPGWPQLAFEALAEYAKHHPTFTIEQARKAMDVPPPPNTKAWGGIITKAMRAGIVEAAGWTQAEDPKVHANLVTLWHSLVCETPIVRLTGYTAADVAELVAAAKAARFVLRIVNQREPGTNETGAIAGLDAALAKFKES